MLRLILEELRRRKERTAALVGGIALATMSFVVLTGAAQSSRLEVRGNVSQQFRTAYDILVRPKASVSSLERHDGLVQENFLGGTFGGITDHQLDQVRDAPGVEIAAPLAVYGFVMPEAVVPIDLGGHLRSGPTAFRVETRWTADRGTVRVPDADSFVFVTPRPLGARPPSDTSQSTHALASEDRGAAGNYPICPMPASAPSPFSAVARSRLTCSSSAVTGDGVSPRVEAPVSFALPLLVAGVDPAAEAALSGLDRSVVRGRFLRPDEGVRRRRVENFPHDEIPVLAVSDVPVDLRASVQVRRLPGKAGLAYQQAGARLGPAQRALRSPGGEIVAHRVITGGDAYRSLVRRMSAADVWVDATWTAGPRRYVSSGSGHLRARPVRNDPYVWGSTYGWTGNGTGFANVAVTARDTQFRHFEQHLFVSSPTPKPLPTLRSVGIFDPKRLPLAGAGDTTSLNLFAPATTDGNMAGYEAPAPALITTLKAGELLLRSERYSVDPAQASAPISAIRVRVGGVHGADDASRERIRLAAQVIAERTGLQVDVTAGSSSTQVTVDVPRSRLGRPARVSHEQWIKKGVVTEILAAVDRKSVVLSTLVLLVCALFCFNATSAAVRTRAVELGVLACVGWPARSLFFYVLLEVGVIGALAGAAGAALGLALEALAGLPVAPGRAAIAIPAATGLALLAGLIPARRASRSDPLEAVRPSVRAGRPATSVRSIRGMAAVNLRRVPGRTALGIASLAVGIFAITVLVAVTAAFRGAVVGTVLGDAVAIQVRTVDFVAAAATLALGAMAVADVLFLNIRDRSAELAALRATGWRERNVSSLVATEGVMIGAIGSVVGALAGLGAAAAFAGEVTVVMWLAALGAILLGVFLTTLATIPPMLSVRRVALTTLLADE